MTSIDEKFAELTRLAETDVAEGQSARGAERMLDLMEEILESTPAALADLVDRFSTSRSIAMQRTVAFSLAQTADRRDAETSGLPFKLAESALGSSDPSTLINCLTAIHRQAIHRRAWTPPDSPPNILVDFFVHCLAQNVLVQDTAIEVLGKLKLGGWLSRLSRSELESIRAALRKVEPESVYKPGLDSLGEL